MGPKLQQNDAWDAKFYVMLIITPWTDGNWHFSTRIKCNITLSSIKNMALSTAMSNGVTLNLLSYWPFLWVLRQEWISSLVVNNTWEVRGKIIFLLYLQKPFRMRWIRKWKYSGWVFGGKNDIGPWKIDVKNHNKRVLKFSNHLFIECTCIGLVNINDQT